MFSQLLLLSASLAATLPLAAAAPANPSSASPNRIPSRTTSSPRITHSVVAGRPGLRFDPENIVAEVGDVVEFHFLPRNHSVVEASFDAPCAPRDDSAPGSPTTFFSGFFPVSPNPDGSVAQSPEVFQIEVRDDKPIWFYCAQNNGRHCQNGMVGAINQRFDTPKTLEAFRRAAAAVPGDSAVLPQVQGGWRGPNPNPNGGF
ncbi:uncharacterized protein P884DRAFT_258452 [Thermothelomyces heterothallicus CBS 202.75]|uniref:uncharacterized protein n=1 Tax=Thermothelomyces heterothallicus CBS 202.75 TaxID=1149848 RepID=UPI0037440A32